MVGISCDSLYFTDRALDTMCSLYRMRSFLLGRHKLPLASKGNFKGLVHSDCDSVAAECSVEKSWRKKQKRTLCRLTAVTRVRIASNAMNSLRSQEIPSVAPSLQNASAPSVPSEDVPSCRHVRRRIHACHMPSCRHSPRESAVFSNRNSRNVFYVCVLSV